MKKKVKNLFLGLMTALFLLGNAVPVSAVDYYSMTGDIWSPYFKLNKWTYGTAYRLSSAYSPLTGGHCGVWFTDLQTLSSGYAATNRTMDVVLGDRLGTTETIIKRYEVEIINRVVTNIRKTATDVEGKVSNTSYGNLFIAGYFPKKTSAEADAGRGLGIRLFKYNIVVE